MTELNSIVDKFGVYIYKNPLIYFRIENFTDWRHREATVKKDPMANAYIQRLDEETLTELPECTPDIFSDKTLLKEWIEENWTDLFITLMNAARTHRWCIVKLYDRSPYWRVFTYREVNKIKYDKYDNPVSAYVEWTADLVLNQEISNHTETLVFNRNTEGTMNQDSLWITFGNPTGSKVGLNDLEAIWDLLVYIRYQMLDIVNNSAKTSGFFHIIYGDAINSDQTTDLKNSFDYTGIGQAIGAKERVIKDIKSHAPIKPEFTVEAMNESLNLLAGACRLPLSFFRGEKEGGGVFQEGFSDEAKINKKKLYVFGQFKKYFIQLIKMRWGKELEDIKPYIEEDIEMDEQMEDEANSQFQQDHFQDNNNKKVKKLA